MYPSPRAWCLGTICNLWDPGIKFSCALWVFSSPSNSSLLPIMGSLISPSSGHLPPIMGSIISFSSHLSPSMDSRSAMLPRAQSFRRAPGTQLLRRLR